MRRALEHLRSTLLHWQARTRLHRRARLAERRFPQHAEALLAVFRGDAPPPVAAYDDLFRYFVTGFVTRRSRLGAYADYGGLDSYNGPQMDRLEGFSRIAPLIAAWLAGGRATMVSLADGEVVDLVALLREGILAGTDPGGAEYWGRIGHWSQAIVEAADIALALWLARGQVWEPLTPAMRARIADWLIQVNGKRIPDNNWHLFVVQVNAVLAALDAPHDATAMQRHYIRAKTFYRGDGWFRDGEMDDTPGFDYYNAWGFHYQLQWLARIDPEFDAAFINEALRAFVADYRHFIGPHGLPMLGRSACYRMAAPAPLIFAQAILPNQVSAGEARRALDVTWQYFVRHGAVAHGNVTQGYFAADARLLEDYSGPASCLWSLRSLVPAFTLPDAHPFWQGAPAPLPVECGDYRRVLPVPGWTLSGTRATGHIRIDTGHTGTPALVPYRPIDRVIGLFARQPHRPKNIAAKYHRAHYDSSSPYGLCDATE